MKIALDIDHTVTAHPEFFLKLFQMWQAATGIQPCFITARPEIMRKQTEELLWRLGFPYATMYMFHTWYEFPYVDEETEVVCRTEHSEWKVGVCKQIGVDVLIDDCRYNVEACRAAGIFVLQVHSPGGK